MSVMNTIPASGNGSRGHRTSIASGRKSSPAELIDQPGPRTPAYGVKSICAFTRGVAGCKDLAGTRAAFLQLTRNASHGPNPLRAHDRETVPLMRAWSMYASRTPDGARL